MDAKTQQQLIEINRRFYAEVADDFDATRHHAWPGWERATAHLPRHPPSPLRVLDVGCGNGRFAHFLGKKFGEGFRYVGVDFSAALLERARLANVQLPNATFLRCDVLDPAAKPAPGEAAFDLIVVFGLLHHVPGAGLRKTLLESLTGRLAPGASLIVTAWQFGQGERFRSHIMHWDEYNATSSDPIDLGQLEPGDHLLHFADAPLPRYCHFVSPEALRTLLTCESVEWIDAFAADGRSGDLNRYAVVRRRA